MIHPTKVRLSSAILGLIVALLCHSSAMSAMSAMSAPRTESGNTLVVPQAQTLLGRVYYVLPRQDAQIVYTSDAPLERVVGVSNLAVGYVVASDDQDAPLQLLAGEFRLPAASLKTGLPLRDEQLHSGRWLNAEDHPDIVFTLDHTENLSPLESLKGATAWAVDFVGALTFRGQTHPLVAKASLTLTPQSPITRRRSPGDLMVVRAVFPVDLRQFGLNDPAMSAGRFAETVSVDVYFMLSTVSPDPPSARHKPE